MAERAYHHGDLRRALLARAESTLRDGGGAERLSLRELARQVGVSHGAPRRHFPDRQALLEALAQTGFERLSEQLRAALERAPHDDGRAGEGFEDRLAATAAAYVRFAIRDAALLELMFASKHGERSGEVAEAAERTFSVVLELIRQGQAEGALEAGDPERVGLMLLATVQGIASLANSGMVAADQLDGLVASAIARFLRGSRAG